MPIIHSSMEENGSPPPVFETYENNAYFLCILPVHPLTKPILGSNKDLRSDEDNLLKLEDLNKIKPYLSLLVAELREQERKAIKERVNETMKGILNHCIEPKSNDEIFEKIGLNKNTKNYNHHIKPLII